jgi:hypothetical protein
LEKKRAADKRDKAWANKQQELARAEKRAQDSLANAESKLKKVQASNELDLMRARHKLSDAERPDEDEASSDSKEA